MQLTPTIMPLLKFQHLTDVHQGYFEHLRDAWSYSFQSIVAGFAFFIHGIFPDALVKTGSSYISNVHTTIQHKYAELNGVTEPRVE